MSDVSWAELVRRVHVRANYFCEYCQTSQRITGQAMHVDHIDPHGGDVLENLCLSCASCNMSKAQATTPLDPFTHEMVLFFNPRTQLWHEHFEWISNGTRLQGLSPTGRATIVRFRMNRSRLIEARTAWVLSGWHPPENVS